MVKRSLKLTDLFLYPPLKTNYLLIDNLSNPNLLAEEIGENFGSFR